MVNELIEETSPYLLQHAHNPVAWRAWSDEVFGRARAEDRLVFLSVGYSTCHWCHVMERESFENPAVAEVMNRHFVNVKVDREERPDVDAAYMAYVQATTGQGGWPMSVWLTPDGKPVFGGTYFPPDDRYQRPGFVRVCGELARLWREDRGRLEESAAKVMEYLRRDAIEQGQASRLPADGVCERFVELCDATADPDWGGFGGAPKFPRPAVVATLLQMGDRFGRDNPLGARAWEMSRRTLEAMAAGGIHDHLGGGFHRYSVDRYWHVPHFEKMLYDQAQLIPVYLTAWQVWRDPWLREVAERTCAYLLESLRDAGGGLHAAEDADSLPAAEAREKQEGAFWTWRAAEIEEILGADDARLFGAAFGVKPAGNARPESDPHGELTGRNTLYRAIDDEALARQFGIDGAEAARRLLECGRRLARVRARRPAPHRDDKIVAAWNGMALGALARAGWILGRQDLHAAAVEVAAFLRREMWDGQRLYRSYRTRRGDAPGFPADYVAVIAGLIELAGGEAGDEWLAWARQLQDRLDGEFWDDDRQGYVMRPGLGGETLWVIREEYDGAEPSPNHLAAENLLKLADLLDEPRHAERAAALITAGARVLEAQPYAAPVLVAAFDLHNRSVMKIEMPATVEPEVARLLRSSYLPRAVFARGGGNEVKVCDARGCRVVNGQQSTVIG